MYPKGKNISQKVFSRIFNKSEHSSLKNDGGLIMQTVLTKIPKAITAKKTIVQNIFDLKKFLTIERLFSALNQSSETIVF